MTQEQLTWSRVALIVGIIIGVVAGTGALVLLRRGAVQEGQTPLKWFRRSTYLTLKNTEDNLPIENVLVYTPFPEKFENLYNAGFILSTEKQGMISTQNGNVLENTLVGREPPVFAVEETEVGKREVVQISRMYPNDYIAINWLFFASENTLLYDEPAENRCKIYVSYKPEKRIGLYLNVVLLYEENRYDADLNNLGELWWRWWRVIESSGWVDAPSENVYGLP